jgi:hypothetical protein
VKGQARVLTVAGLHFNWDKLSRAQRCRLLAVKMLLAPLSLFGILSSFEVSTFGAQMALDQVFGRVQGPAARTVYLALLTAAPTDASTLATMTETTMTGYARQAFTPSAASSASPSEVHNTNTITFGPVTGTMATVSHFAIVSASSGTAGDFLCWGALTTARTPISGDSLQAAASGFSITLT